MFKKRILTKLIAISLATNTKRLSILEVPELFFSTNNNENYLLQDKLRLYQNPHYSKPQYHRKMMGR